MEEDELVLDNGLRLARLKIGGLIDSDGNALFRSELPVSFGSDPGDGGYTGSDPGDGGYTGSDPGDYGYGTAQYTAEDFYGCWEYTHVDEWLCFYDDGTYEWFDEDGSSYTGRYYMAGGELCLEGSGRRFLLEEADNMSDSDGGTLFRSELPEFADEPYFVANGIEINYSLGQGDVWVEDAGASYQSGNESDSYELAPLICAMELESEEDLGNGYKERTVVLYQGLLEEDVPWHLESFRLNYGYCFSDYYSGVILPDTEYFQGGQGETSHYYEFESEGGWVDLYLNVDHVVQEYVGQYRFLLVTTATVTAPDWYDGLVLSVQRDSPTYEDELEEREGWNGLESLVPALEAPVDLGGLNCLIL